MTQSLRRSLGCRSLFVLSLAALTTTITHGQAREPGPKMTRGNRVLEIVDVSAPAQVQLGQSFDVVVTAADHRGSGVVEIIVGDYVTRVPLNGRRELSTVVTVPPVRHAGPIPLRARVVALEGRSAGEPYVATIDTTLDHALADPPDPDIQLRMFRSMQSERDYAIRTGLLETLKPNVQVRAVDPRPWWTRWQDSNGPKRFDWSVCGVSTLNPSLPDAAGGILNCWLNLHPNVRNRIVWIEVDSNAGGLDVHGNVKGTVTKMPYSSWTVTMKLQLGAAFFYAYQYLHGGATWFNGQWLPPVPPNQMVLADQDSARTKILRDDAWALYLGTIAHSLALEIGGFVPWSITNYQPLDLDVLFNADSMLDPEWQDFMLNDEVHISGSAYWVSNMIAAPPTTTFEFLLENNAIRSTQLTTVEQYLAWARKALAHTGGYEDGMGGHTSGGQKAADAEAYWGYRGETPAAAVMSGTIFIAPGGGVHPLTSWVFGCPGVSYFTQAALRVVNIPVQIDNPAGVHTAPLFWTIDRALSHGDEVYGYGQAHATPMYPPGAILIPIATYDDWFYGAGQLGTAGIANVGRQVRYELPLTWLSDELLQRYCADKASNATHATGTVAKFFRDTTNNATVYSVTQLESMNLWQKLGAKAASLGYCSP